MGGERPSSASLKAGSQAPQGLAGPEPVGDGLSQHPVWAEMHSSPATSIMLTDSQVSPSQTCRMGGKPSGIWQVAL